VKVIFIEDVPNVARVGQTRVVADGYARNYLLPRKLVVVANSQAAVAIESQLKKKIKQRELEEAEMAGLAEKINEVEITLKARVGESEKLYGSVTGADIAEELSKSAGYEVDKKKIEMAEPIRQLGSHDVTVRFTHDITAVIKVNVISDEEVEEKPEKAEKKEKKTKAKSKKKAKARAEEPEAGAKVEEVETKVEVVEEKPEKAEKKEKKTKAKSKKKAKARAEEPEAETKEDEVETKVAVAEEKPEKAEKAKKKEKKTKAKTKKKAKAKVEEPEARAKVEEAETKVEEAEEKEKESGE